MQFKSIQILMENLKMEINYPLNNFRIILIQRESTEISKIIVFQL